MFTRPDDVADDDLRAALRTAWSIDPGELSYAPVGFGSHHWAAGSGHFLTVDVLGAKRRSATETLDDTFERYRRAFATAHALHHDGGLAFVVAPLPTTAGSVLWRLDDTHSLVVHPMVDGAPAGADGEYERDADRDAVLGLLVELHRCEAGREHAAPEDGAMQNRDDLEAAIAAVDDPWEAGPYAERARALLHEHVDDIPRIVKHFDDLAAEVTSAPERMVVTHGEPHAGNVLVHDGRHLLIDWDSALLAPPERDLWELDVDAYRAATGTAIVPDALRYYRLWYDLMEIGGYLGLFRGEHGDTADAAESWKNLQHFLQPRARWPELFAT